MGCASTIGRLVLVVINIIFLLVSLVLIAAGAILKYFVDKVLPYLGDVDAATESVRQDLHIPSLSQVTELPFVKESGTALLVFGCVLFVISFCACCGACYQFRLLLIVFAVVMVLLVIGQATVGGLFLSRNSALHDKIRENLVEQMKDDYSENGNNVITFAVNMMNYLLDCCGINGWQDFSNGQPVKSCCKADLMTSSDPNERAKCKDPAINPDASFNKMGCYDKLLDKVLSQKTTMAVVLALILGLQVVEVVFAILIVKDTNLIGPV